MSKTKSENQYWSASVSFKRETEGPRGAVKIKNVKERYLVFAISPTDVEAQITTLLKGTQEEWEVTGVTATNYVEVIAIQAK